MSKSTGQYTQIEASLALAVVEVSAPEVHGLIVGAISNHLKTAQTPNLLQLTLAGSTTLESQNEQRYKPLSDLLNELYRDTSAVLFEADDSFELVLPDEDEALEFRVEGLASWCRGYLLGLLHNQQFSIDQLPENGAEIVRDIMQIAEAEAEPDEQQKQDWALAELEEYIKVGVQLVFEFIYSERASDAPATTQ